MEIPVRPLDFGISSHVPRDYENSWKDLTAVHGTWQKGSDDRKGKDNCGR